MNVCTVSPDSHHTFLIVTALIIVFGGWIALTAIHHAITRLRISSTEEFMAANERLTTGIELLKEFHGHSLRVQCHLLSRDLIQVTKYAERNVSLCLHKYYQLPNERERINSLLNLLNENRTLKAEAVLITLIYFTPLPTWLMLVEMNDVMDFYSTRWFPLFQAYTAEFLDCL
jgi:hypothetical protein